MTRVILSYQLDFLMPISRVDENMQTAQKRDACRKEKFWFRKMTQKARDCCEDLMQKMNGSDCEKKLEKFELMTIGEIFNGKADSFPGLVPLIRSYLQSMEVDTDTHCTIEQYLRFIQKRASGDLVTTATWMREEVLKHPDYKKDSIVSDSINYDLLRKIKDIQEGKIIEAKLLGYGNHSKTKDFIPPALQKHLTMNGCDGK